MLKYQLIPTKTAAEEAFWKCGQTDRQTERQTHRQTRCLTITVAIAERSRTNNKQFTSPWGSVKLEKLKTKNDENLIENRKKIRNSFCLIRVSGVDSGWFRLNWIPSENSRDRCMSFYRLDAPPVTQPTASKHWRKKKEKRTRKAWAYLERISPVQW